MGLDIYLDTRAGGEAIDAYDTAWNAFYERPDLAELTDAQREEIRASLPEYAGHADVPSEQYPDHLFNRRYLRSSYNGGGFNNAVSEFLGADRGLYWIFEPIGRDFDGADPWYGPEDIERFRACRERALQVADELRKCEPLRTVTISHNAFRGLQSTTDAEALAWYREQTGKPRSEGWWSNLTGMYFGETPPTLLGACPGVDALGSPSVHLIYRAEDESLQSYVQSAEITAEFCEEAIALISADCKVYMSWSG